MKLARLIKMCLNETHSKVHIDKRYDVSPLQNGLKQDVSLPLFFNFALGYAIRKEWN
jgi:hypothetical protein